MAPETIILLVMLTALTLYAVLGGADFGGGVWEFNTALKSSESERRLIYAALGPVWEANHVWLIFVLVLMANGFPPALAALSRALWLPLLLALAGIVFRGAAFAFKSYSVGADQQQRLWNAVFALASTMAPLCLGASVGAVASGQLPLLADGTFTGDYLTGWLSPLAIFTAFFAVGMCAYLAAFYLTREAAHTKDAALCEQWRVRSLATGAGMGVLSLAGLALIASNAPQLWAGFQSKGWPFIALSLTGGFLSLWTMWTRRYNLAVLSAAVAVGAVVFGWGVAQYPALIPPAVLAAETKAPDAVLWAMVVCVATGTVLLVPSLVWLFSIFKTRPDSSPSR